MTHIHCQNYLMVPTIYDTDWCCENVVVQNVVQSVWFFFFRT